MKKTLLFIFAISSLSMSAQDPVVLNATLDPLARTGSSDCSCAGWMNKDLGDQLESSSWNSDTSFGAKFDDTESDVMYQEIAVLANTDYKFTYVYNFEAKGTDALSSQLDVRILAGSAYTSGYTPAYPAAADGVSRDFGYPDIADVENASNNLVSEILDYPGDKDFRTREITFSTGSNTSIAIFLRGIGRDVTGSNSKGYAWSNGQHEIRIDEVSMTNEGATASVDDFFSSQISAYPNPAKDFIQVSSTREITGIAMYNLIGKKVVNFSSVNNNRIDTSKLAKGIYVLKVSSNELVGTKKIIIE
ncbi:T9SS type A sorting domain-containing protein [Polaribacter sp.]|nr:T9SS type A sorting domain-containing protein [Polaribacter sp.]